MTTGVCFEDVSAEATRGGQDLLRGLVQRGRCSGAGFGGQAARRSLPSLGLGAPKPSAPGQGALPGPLSLREVQYFDGFLCSFVIFLTLARRGSGTLRFSSRRSPARAVGAT